MDEQDAAARDLARIRALMERAGRYSHLSGYSAVTAGLLAMGGSVLCWILDVDFTPAGEYEAGASRLGAIWGGVFLLALAQHLAFTAANARRLAEPVWSDLTRRVVQAVIPALFVGIVITVYGVQTRQLELLPPIWMLAYGSSLMGLGLFAGWRFRLAAALFLLLGAGALWWGLDHGRLMMLVSFGGLHLLLGAWIAWKPQA